MSIIICLHPWKHRFLLPLPLLGIGLSSILVLLLQIPVLSLADFTKQHGHQFHGGWESLPTFVPFPSEIPWSLETIMTIFPGALGMSTVAIMETMVTQKVIVETMRKEIKKEYRQRRRQEEKERKREQTRERDKMCLSVEQKRLHGTDEEVGSRIDSLEERHGQGLEEREQRGDNGESDCDNHSENSEDTDGGFENDNDEIDREIGEGMHDDMHDHHYEKVDESHVEEDNAFPPLHSNDSYDGDKLDDKRLRISLSSSRVHDDNIAIIGVGIGTFMTAMFGGFGGCPLLPKTILNIVTGGRSAISTTSYAFSLMAMILFCGPLIGCIPMAALTGVMLSIAYETVRWKESWRLIEQSPKSFQACLNAIAMLLTSYLSFAVDMGLGVIVGVFVVKLPAIYGWCSESCCSSMRLLPKIASS